MEAALCFYQTLSSKAFNKHSLNMTFPSSYTGMVTVSGEVVGMPPETSTGVA